VAALLQNIQSVAGAVVKVMERFKKAKQTEIEERK